MKAEVHTKAQGFYLFWHLVETNYPKLLKGDVLNWEKENEWDVALAEAEAKSTSRSAR